MQNDVVASAVKVAPPISITWAWLAGIDLPHLVMFLTFIYTGLQIIFLIYDRVFKK